VGNALDDSSDEGSVSPEVSAPNTTRVPPASKEEATFLSRKQTIVPGSKLAAMRQVNPGGTLMKRTKRQTMILRDQTQTMILTMKMIKNSNW
jgi:hypothetical protein